MKTFFSLLLTLVMAAPAMAQGKIRLVNNSVHCVYFTTDTSRLIDPALAGQAYVLGQGGQTLTVELWAGTSSTSLSLSSATSFTGQGTPGLFPGANITLYGIAAGTTAFFQVKIYDSAAGSYDNAVYSMFHYRGASSIFTAVPGSAAYNPIISHSPAPGAASTWADGTQPVLGSFPGATGSIALVAGPEPSVIALGSLAFAMLLLRRRAETRRVEK